MARAYASRIIKAPVETVWSVVRNFNGLPAWAVGIADSKIEGGLDADVVGCVRSFHTKDGAHIRERLLTLDDAHYSFTYNFEKPAFPVKNYIATMRLMPVTHGDATFIEWEATFDEATGDEGKYVKLISNDVFAAGLKALGEKIKREKLQKPEGSVRWKAWAPNKVWTSRVIKAPADQVWGKMRDFGMRPNSEITKMHAEEGAARQGFRGAGFLFRRRAFERGVAASLRSHALIFLPYHQV
jgi:uncharacterized protein YndB with AHSA1/START domain